SAAAEWRPLEVDLGTLPARRIGTYSRLEVLEAVSAFVATLHPGDTATCKRWRDFSRGRSQIPSYGVVKRHGGLPELAAEVAMPGWRERAARVPERRFEERSDSTTCRNAPNGHDDLHL